MQLGSAFPSSRSLKPSSQAFPSERSPKGELSSKTPNNFIPPTPRHILPHRGSPSSAPPPRPHYKKALSHATNKNRIFILKLKIITEYFLHFECSVNGFKSCLLSIQKMKIHANA